MQLSLLLEMASDAFPDRTALGPVRDGIRLASLAKRVRGAAAFLGEEGGETIVFLGLNGEALPVSLFASALLGKPFTPVNYRLPDAALRTLLIRTAPSVVIADDDMVARVSGLDGVRIVARSTFEAAANDPSFQEIEGFERAGIIAVLLFTSGTTGEPKVAVLRHHHLTSYVLSTVEFMGADETEAALISVPPYHIAGISAILTGIYGGRRIVYLPSFSPEAWVKLALDQRITHAMVVPTMLDRILDRLEAQAIELPALQALSYGGGRMPLAVIERAMHLLPHVEFVNAYGLTETSSTIAILTPADHREAMTSPHPDVRRRLGSVGRPLTTLEIEIRDPDGRILSAGELGEIYVRGEQVAGEYLHKKALRDDGWFPTNDAGWLDGGGYLFVEGRLDDVIVRGGENISPGEIEDVLRTHPSIADVAVIGLPDDQWGERIACVVVLRSQELPVDEFAAWAKERLRSSKTPEVWESRVELPYNETGKLLRRVLRAELIARTAVTQTR
jgi:fatty-acyl-CoA synthase